MGFQPESALDVRSPSWRISRRKFLLYTATAGAAAIGIDGVLIEPMRPRLVRKEISLKRWPARMDGFTIAQLSDFHYDPVFSVHVIRSAINLTNSLRPDVVVLTGDFVTSPLLGNRRGAAADAEPCAELLRTLHAPYGRWAVLGNHDASSDPRRVISTLRAAGIGVLTNAAVPLERDGGRFWLSGVQDVIARSADLYAALAGVPSHEPTVLLAHEPDYADYVARYPVDLQLSGHSHGGQIRLPYVRPLYLPSLARKYYLGLYGVGPLVLYTNCGLGTIRIPMRLNAPPEVTLFTLRRG